MTTGTDPDARLNLRLPARLKAEIERAAALAGQTTTDFVLGSVAREAWAVLRQAEALELSARDRDRLLAALDDPAPPNAALRRAAGRHRALLG